ncbi:MAG: hypothetical protein IPH93_11840 [Saprospiraceae bacterium]|nr:hypothetical protein [Saprospiraceae bacterium]MBK7812648.1 hypothetical protein [Saprospiraceae bacterium]MBK9630840.1 hypothetical protein [Saprospiraceae bacterium]
MMKKTLLAFTLILSSFVFVNAQSEINPLSFMVGEWKGTGSMMTRGGKQFTDITETVVCKLDCAVLSVDGLGTKLDSTTGKQIIVHDAFGIISKDPKSNKWIMRAYKKGEVIDAEIIIVGEKVIRWELAIPNNGGTMRFTTDFTSPDKWKGIGEYSTDGINWMIMMQTELTKVNE